MTEMNEEYTPGPTAGRPAAEAPQMSEVGTLGNVFFEPGSTFEDLRRKPRFILAGLIVILAATAFQVAFIQKIGYEAIVRAQIEASSWTKNMPPDQKEQTIRQQSGTIGKVIAYAAVPVVLLIVFFLGGLIYWLGSKAVGGTATYLHGVSVWVYSSLPPTLLFVIANLIVLFFKGVENIDIEQARGGVVQANPAMLINAREMPVLAAILGSLDLFAIWGWFLAAVGLQKVAKISSGAAWGIVLTLVIIGVLLKVVGALLF